MSRTVRGNHRLPENPTYVSFPDSDGDSSQWPSNTTRIVDSDGHVNYYDPQPLDSPVSIRWRVAVADGVAAILEWDNSKEYVLQDWPRDYAFYVHNKGPREKPRQDVYLMGGPSRFRSILEFVPHAAWLFRNQSVPCICKYCTKQPQKTITSSLSSILRLSPGRVTPSIRPTKQSNRIKTHLREQKIYATVQKVLLHASKNLAGTMLVERNQDLRAVSTRGDAMKLKRWFRSGELLWCALTTPIRGHNDEDDSITFWPGLVDEANLHTQPSRPQNGTNNEDSATWVVEQSTRYRIKVLATSDMITIADDQVLPYQAYVPPASLIETLSRTPPVHFDFNKDSLAHLHPFPQSPEHHQPSFRDAVSAYTLALQIGSAVAQFWSLTDEWEFDYTVPPPIGIQPTSLYAALNMASQSGSQDPGFFSDLGSQVLGVVPAGPATGGRSQTRFQGLWWGAERIWADDFVRLKIPRRCLAPGGAQNVLPPSGPGLRTQEQCRLSNLDPSQYGAGIRGVFMKLEGLFTVDVPSSDGGIVKECRASGMLYELADDDWEEEGPSVSTAQPLNQNAWTLPTIDARSPSAQLSHPPRSAQYLLPNAPTGFKFRAILPEGFECVLSLTLISGRYYPNILGHPLLRGRIEHAAQAHPDQLPAFDYLWALEGVAAGYTNAVDPEQYMPNRLKMLEEADKISRQQLERHVQDTASDDPMEFDD